MSEEVKALRSELALLKLQFSEKLNAVEARLNALTSAEEPVQNSVSLEHSSVQVTTDIFPPEPPINASQKVKVTPPNKSLLSKIWNTPAGDLSELIMVCFSTLLPSLFDWFSPLTKIYQNYKAKGMLGTFILTIVGIGLTLSGFGYLMQLLIDQLGAGAKSLLVCGGAVLVMVLGIVLKIKTRFSEFATAIVTLGVLLAYSAIYFSGSVYGLLPNLVILVLYVAIALLCHFLALWLDTKVVAALGIIGIATMPILSSTTSIAPLYYLLSLVFVTSSSLFLAYKRLGNWLAHLSLAFVLASLEWIVGIENIAVSAWIISLFYLLFFAYITASLLKTNDTPKPLLVFLMALSGATILIFFQASDVFTTAISVSFAVHMLIALVTSVLFYKVKRELADVYILLAATWAILTIVSAISDAYWGIAWAIEGLLLLYIGRKYLFSSTINQGQVLIAIALAYSWSALAMYFPLPALQSVDGWTLSIVIIMVIAIWQRIINQSEPFNKFTQSTVKPTLQLLEVVWLTVLLIVSADIWLGNWTGALMIIVQAVILFRAKYCKQVAIEVFAAVLITIPLFYIYKGAVEVDSYRFTQLPIFAKLAVVSAFVQLWLWSAFYRKYQPNSAILPIAEHARIAFYLLIPICWVGSVIRHFGENAIMLLWWSPLLALLLAKYVNHHLLVKQTKLLTALATVCFVIISGQLNLTSTAITLIGFSSFYSIAYWLNRKEPQHVYQFICSWGILSLGFAVPAIVGLHSNNLWYGAIVASCYWSAMFNNTLISHHLKSNETFITLTNLVLIICGWLLMSVNVNYVLVPVIFLIAALYKKEQRFLHSSLAKLLKGNTDLFLHSVAAVSYVVLFASFTGYRLDLLIAPALAVHGALILFLKDKRLTTVKYSFGLILLGIVKLAMIDAANALLWQKVILFMGVGVFILVASFWYQKLVNRVQAN